MIQIDNWTIITGIVVIFVLSIVYVVYIIVTSKLFPKTIDFYKEINPNEAVAISTIDGLGIIKKIEMSTTENNESFIDMIIDQTSFMVVSFNTKATIQSGNLDPKIKNLNIELNLNKKFRKNFTIFFQNRSETAAYLNGNINFEIKKSLKTTLRTLLSELL